MKKTKLFWSREDYLTVSGGENLATSYEEGEIALLQLRLQNKNILSVGLKRLWVNKTYWA
jgi:hypothetical protein